MRCEQIFAVVRGLLTTTAGGSAVDLMVAGGAGSNLKRRETSRTLFDVVYKSEFDSPGRSLGMEKALAQLAPDGMR